MRHPLLLPLADAGTRLPVDDLSMIALALALALSSPLPPGTVVAGVSVRESARTDVTAFLPDGSSRVLFTQAHAPGFVPKGALDGEGARAALAVQFDGAEGASVLVVDLATGAATHVGDRAIASQAPSFTNAMRMPDDVGRISWVRAAERPSRSTFDVVGARADGRGEEVLASIEGAWLSPLAHARYLHITSDGESRVVALEGTALESVRVLGKGRFRLPALLTAPRASSMATERLLVERGLPEGRAEIVDERGAIVRTGLAGMDPIAVGDVVVMGAGTKHAGLVVLEGKRERIIDLGRAGIATPRAGVLVDGALVVAAWLDRGRILPGELVVVDAHGPRLLVEHANVEVYGVIGGAR